MLNFIGLVLAPKAEKKRIPSNLGSQFATIGGQFFSIYFISNLGADWKLFFSISAWTPSIKPLGEKKIKKN
jgi:hypothetical protein